MSPERTSHATSLPVRADRPARADATAGDDTFATLLGAHADRPDHRSATRRERGPADGRPHQPDDRARRDRADAHGRRAGAPAADQPATRAPAADQPATRAPAADQPATSAPAAAVARTGAASTQEPAAAPAAPDALFALALATPQGAPVPVPAATAGAPVAAQPVAAPVAPLAAPIAGGGPATGREAGAHAATAAPATAPIASDQPAQPAAAPAQPIAADAGAPAAPAPGSRPAELPAVPASAPPHAQDRPAGAPVDVTGPASPSQASAAGGESAARQGDGRPAGRQPAAAPVAQAAAPTTSSDLPPVAAPTAAPAQAVAPSQGTASLSQAPRAVGQLIHLATQSGVQRARLNLRPAELGGIEIRLQATAAGISAQVVADSPHAARLLQQASDDLRRSLASQDVQLLSLDVSTSGEERRDASAASSGFGAFGDPGTRGQAGLGRERRAGAGPEPDSELLPTAPAGTVLELPDGVLVDVLA